MADVYNVVRGDGVFFEGMTKEQIITAIAEATGVTVEDIDSAFITKLKEINKGNTIQIWMGTNAEYNAIENKLDDVLYIVTDDTFVSDTNTSIEDLYTKIEANYTGLEALVNATLESFDDRLTTVEETLSIETRSYAFTINSDTSNGTASTVTLGDDIDIGQRVIVYVNVLFKAHFDFDSTANISNGDFHVNSEGVNINAKTSGSYRVISNEIIGNNGNLSITSKVGTQSVTLARINSFDEVYSWTEAVLSSGYDFKGNDVDVPTKSMSLKIEVERLS